MDTIAAKIEQLTLRLYELTGQQAGINDQLTALRKELELLKQQAAAAGLGQTATSVTQVQPNTQAIPADKTTVAQPVPTTQQQVRAITPPRPPAPARKASPAFEEFLGKNLASKVGILVTIIGIFIGARYAIEHNLVSASLRIIVGYLSGLALIGIALKLKKKYEGYSAVLMGGGLSVLYFITYIAHSYYGIISQVPAFALMLVFTTGIIYAALLYDRVIIAHLAQVGAYAIPFLLSNNSGQYATLFTYTAIINAGVMILAFRKYWKSLFYVAFGLTWLIFLVWFLFSYVPSRHQNIAWIFAGINFITFYGTFLAYKLVKREVFNFGDIVVVLINAFIFYGIGMGLLNSTHGISLSQGWFTVINAGIHLGVSVLIRRLQLADRRLYYLVFGLAIVFFTISIPVEFDGNWVTLLWTLEAVLVFFIGRTKQSAAYEKLGAGLVVLSFFSLAHDWVGHQYQFLDSKEPLRPFLNMTFLTGLIVLAAYSAIVWINKQKKYSPAPDLISLYREFYNYAMPVIFLITGYLVFQFEIQGYFRQVAAFVHGADGSFGPWGSEVHSFSFIILLLYAMVFTTIVIVVNQQWVKNKRLARFSLLGILVLVLILLLRGLPVLNDMAATHFDRDGSGLFFGRMNFLVRYIILGIVKLLIYLGIRVVKDTVTESYLQKTWWLMVFTISLSFTSFEYLHWMRVSGAGDQYKLGLSVIWGLFALGLIVYGIWKKLRYIRLAAMVLLIITLLKLFIYDLAEAGTVTKTVSFISLGVILLLVSYLYNRYKDVLFGVEPEEVKSSNEGSNAS